MRAMTRPLLRRHSLKDSKFPKENVRLITESKATKKEILQHYLGFSNDSAVLPDDRIVFFFAGHGHTITGRKGEVGYLVPFDGKTDDPSSLIRWDELTRNAELIPAKHMLFLMDACYGGLALTRKPLATGTMRFVKDMLQRYSRQVLTAGKANEVVADFGGPRRGHSIFTAHLLDGLDGAAFTQEGILTANRLMAYVYEKVSGDANSQQTPHFGMIEGDGDLVFDTSPLDALPQAGTKETDILVKVTVPEQINVASDPDLADTLKELIAEPAKQIRLDDLLNKYVRTALSALSVENFPVQGTFNGEQFSKRLGQYEKAIEDIETVVILLGRWADSRQHLLLSKIFGRLGDGEKGSGGTVGWLSLGWYPLCTLVYAAGIAAISGQNYTSLASILTSQIQDFAV